MPKNKSDLAKIYTKEGIKKWTTYYIYSYLQLE